MHVNLHHFSSCFWLFCSCSNSCYIFLGKLDIEMFNQRSINFLTTFYQRSIKAQSTSCSIATSVYWKMTQKRVSFHYSNVNVQCWFSKMAGTLQLEDSCLLLTYWCWSWSLRRPRTKISWAVCSIKRTVVKMVARQLSRRRKSTNTKKFDS